MGTVTYVLAIALQRRQKRKEVLCFILFLTFLLLVMLNAVVLSMVQAAFPGADAATFILTFTSRILAVGIAASAIFLLNALFGILQSRAATIVIFGAAGLLAGLDIVIAITSYRGGILAPLPFKQFSPEDLLVYLAAVYPFVTSFLYLKRIENPVIFKLLRALLVFSLCFFPFLILDEFNISLTLGAVGPASVRIHFWGFPLFYIAFNFILIYYGFKFYIREQSALSPSPVSDDFARAFKISEREKEVIRLLQEGCSNKEIGEKLFISPATVRNHLHNLFEKTGAKNRVDLLRRARG